MASFTPGEMSVMRLLWEHGALKPSELQQLYPEPIKNPALRSYLTILLNKGHVTRRKVGKAYYYQAVTARQSAFRTKLQELADSFCNGSTQSLLMNLIRSEKLSEAELLALRQMAGEESPDVFTRPQRTTTRSSRAKRKRRRQ
jgi:predicted transcriptional regulator